MCINCHLIVKNSFALKYVHLQDTMKHPDTWCFAQLLLDLLSFCIPAFGFPEISDF